MSARRAITPLTCVWTMLSVQSSGRAVRTAAARLAGLWKLEALRSKLLEKARAEQTATALRQAALEGLVALGGKENRDAIDQLAGPGNAPERRRLAVTALTALDVELAARRAAELLALDSGQGDPTPMFEAFLQRTYSIVAAGEESDYLDFDAELTAFIGEA